MHNINDVAIIAGGESGLWSLYET